MHQHHYYVTKVFLKIDINYKVSYRSALKHLITACYCFIDNLCKGIHYLDGWEELQLTLESLVRMEHILLNSCSIKITRFKASSVIYHLTSIT